MAQRNILCTSQMHDLEIEQGQSHLQPEPCILLGNMVNFPNPNIHPVLSAPGNATNLDHRHLPMDHQDSSMFYGNQYNGLQHRHPVINIDLNSVAPSNFTYNPYMVPSSTSRIGPMPLNHGSSDHIPSSSNHGLAGVSLDEYGRNTQFMDNLRGSCKRKTAEGVPGNFPVSGSASSSSSSSGVPLNSGPQQWEEPFETGVGVLEPTGFTTSDYRGSGVLSINEGSQRSVRSRSSAINLQMDSSLAHQNQLLQGNYMGRSFQAAGNAWVEQFGSNGGDGSSSGWSYAPSMAYLHGSFLISSGKPLYIVNEKTWRSINGGPLEIGSMSGQGYQDTISGRNSGILLHPSSMHHPHPPPLPVQGMQGSHSYGYHPQVPTPSYRHPTTTNLHHGTLNPSRDVLESGSRYPRPFSSSGDRMFRPHRRGPQGAPDGINGRMRYLSEDVAILEFSGFYGVGNLIDQHRDMRLDIDDMSYEELLALEERIGDVNTGLSEESIRKCLKTKIHVSCIASSPPDQSASMMQDNGTCIICQVEYEENETIGILDCGHNYHADCIKQWLLLKNICPICKVSALSSDGKEG
ncbi:probable E3 ubiquitin-protein ligase ZFP1 isoform X2 [Magnolia sinica]|uniref:probable E3 ubiquitin-protein ligase ZFP1 isoform X2 n=1 Tax=Magnolia sinica TaxID=86752 RepID=UPI0026598AA3|nr:probable E3 ubiquitin-protein ligase ZFP1 isoform X2 [Magnolia sinica]